MKPMSYRLFAATFIVSLIVGAQSSKAETLSEALSKAYLNNPTLRSERSALKAQDESVVTAVAGQRPALSLATTLNRQNSQTTKSVSTTPTSMTLSLSQTLYRGGRIRKGIELAEVQILSSRAKLVTVEQQVLSSVVNAYVNLLRDQAVVQLNRSSEEVLIGELNATRDRFQLGAATKTDVSQSESRVSAAAASRIQSEGQLQSSIATYVMVMGESPNNIETPDPLENLPETLEDAIIIALNENPSLMIAELSRVAAEHNIKLATGALLPTLNLSASTRRTSDWTKWGAPTKVNSIGLSFSLPLYQGGKEYSAIRKAKQSASKAIVDLDASRRNIKAQVTKAWYQLATARAAIYSRAEQVRASEVALDGVRQEEAVGARTLLNVLNAEKDLLNARVALVTSRRDEIVASYSLLSAMGRLTVGGLGLAVETYDPTNHYQKVRNKWIR